MYSQLVMYGQKNIKLNFLVTFFFIFVYVCYYFIRGL